MSSKKKYQVVSAGDFKIKPLDTLIIPTNTFLKIEHDELAFFQIEESLYKLHGIICVEPVIECEEESRLMIKISKICSQTSRSIENNIHAQIFGTPEEFSIKENMVIGNLTLLSL